MTFVKEEMLPFKMVNTAEQGWKTSPDRNGYTILCLAYEALAKWYLNGWRDQNFCEGQLFRF